MPGRHRITCTQKGQGSHPHELITHIGGRTSAGTRWKISLTEAILGIHEGVWAFYVQINGETHEVQIAKDASGAEYLKTSADTEEPRHLLNLPDCTLSTGEADKHDATDAV